MVFFLSGFIDSVHKNLKALLRDGNPQIPEAPQEVGRHQSRHDTDPSRGWGSDIQWTGIDKGRAEASAGGRPVMVVLHRMSCAGCGWLKREFATSGQIRELSRDFVMVNLLPEEIPKNAYGRPDLLFAPDGFYVPRILFFSPEGSLLRQIKGSTSQYQYTYPQAWDIVESMKRVKSMQFQPPRRRSY